MTIKELMKLMIEKDASDLFFRTGGPPRLRIYGKVVAVEENELALEDVVRAVEELTNSRQIELFKKNLDVDFALFSEELDHRFRVSIFMQRNWPSLVIRRVPNKIRSFEELGLPAEVLKKVCAESRGLILLTGATGSGKSTTITSMIDYINSNYQKHILTVEEPIEFAFKDKKSIINQRELGADVTSYAAALHAFTLQSPDVIYIGNIRDYETMAAALTVADTGSLVLTTLHTINAGQSIERIVNFFPPYQHVEVRQQLAYLLKAVISLRLISSKKDGGRVPAFETMLLTPTIGRLIREGKIWEIPSFIEDGSIFGMQSFNQSLVQLVNQGKISVEDAMNACDNKDDFMLSLKGIRRA